MSGRGWYKIFVAFAVLLLVPSPIIAWAAEIDSEFTKYDAEDIANDPSAQYILDQIEKSYQILEEMQSGGPAALTEQQRLVEEKQRIIDEQRKIAQQQLQDQLDRMNKRYEEYTPRNAFAKYVSGFPEEYHEFLWEHFNYMYSKVEIAREHRDMVLANGGSYHEALEVFVQHAAITKNERHQFTEDMIEKYELYNKISNIDDFNDLPEDTKIAFIDHMESIGLGKYALRPMYDRDPDEQETQVIEPVNLPVAEQIEPQIYAVDYSEPAKTVSEITIEEPVIEITTEDIPEPIVAEQEPITVRSFYGNNYDTIHMPSMDYVSEFTVSALVKPDYSSGSSEFTIISKENAFTLSISKNLSDKVAKFSVFNGYKWTTIESTSIIPEEWTHIAATLDDNNIAIYINGNQEASSTVEGIPTVTPSGIIELAPIEGITSNSSVLVGAQQFTKHGETSTKAYLSGSIDEILIDNEKLDIFEIRELLS